MAPVSVLLAGFYVSVMVDSKIALEGGSDMGFQSQISGTNEVGVLRKLLFNSPGVGGGGDRQERLASALAKILRLPIQRDSEDRHVMRNVASESEISKALINIMARRGAHENRDHHGREGFIRNMFNVAADEEEVLRKRVTIAFTDFFQLPPGRTEERSHSNEEIVSEKEISNALASLFSKGGNQQYPNLKGGGNLFERIVRIPGKEGISMNRVVAALTGMIEMPPKKSKEPLLVKSVASEEAISKAIANIMAKGRSKRQAVNEDDIKKAICSVTATPGELFRLVA